MNEEGEKIMMYITGDCHGNFERFNTSIFPEQNEMTKDDYVIICEDFGGVWSKELESRRETMVLDWLDCKPFTTLFVSGNHENFDRLKEYPVEEWHGGKIQRIRPSVIHLMRGQVFELEGKKEELDKGWKPYRINHLSWWKEELPTVEEMNEGRVNLKKCNNEVDFIVTHCASSNTAALLSHGLYEPDLLTDYLEEIRQKVKFKKWFFGHYHGNINVNTEEILLWEQIIRIS